jgi:hypothetical protein
MGGRAPGRARKPDGDQESRRRRGHLVLGEGARGLALAGVTVWQTIALEAANESALWAAALRPEDEREELPIFSALADERFALGVESIYEGYLLHYGASRLFAPADRDTSILLGDYLYAHGLVRVAAQGDVGVVAELAELLALCAHLRAERRPGDGDAWAATIALLGRVEERLAEARTALTQEADSAPLLDLAESAAGEEPVARALALHRTHLS